MRLLFLFLLLLNTVAVAQAYTDPETKRVYSSKCHYLRDIYDYWPGSNLEFYDKKIKHYKKQARKAEWRMANPPVEEIKSGKRGMSYTVEKYINDARKTRDYFLKDAAQTEAMRTKVERQYAEAETQLSKAGCYDIPPLPKGRLSDTFKELVVGQGYRCDSVSYCCPKISWHEETNRPSSYKMTCDNNEYEYKIEARGGRWIVEKLK